MLSMGWPYCTFSLFVPYVVREMAMGVHVVLEI